MPKYVIERDFPGAGDLTDEQLREGSLQSLAVLRELGPGIEWLHSFVTENKVYCIYYAPDDSLIKEHGRLTGMPISRICTVRKMLDPSNFGA